MKDWILLAALILGAAFAEGPVMDKQKETLIPIVLDSIPDHREPPQAPQKPPDRWRADIDQELLACIRHWESRGNYAAVSASGKHRGAYQFSEALWRAYFGDKTPAQTTAPEQDAAALTVLHHDGGLESFRWPTPYRKCR